MQRSMHSESDDDTVVLRRYRNQFFGQDAFPARGFPDDAEKFDPAVPEDFVNGLLDGGWILGSPAVRRPLDRDRGAILFLPAPARAAPRWMAVVVFPTPPYIWGISTAKPLAALPQNSKSARGQTTERLDGNGWKVEGPERENARGSPEWKRGYDNAAEEAAAARTRSGLPVVETPRR